MTSSRSRASALVAVAAAVFLLLQDHSYAQTVHQQRATIGVLVDLHQAVVQPNRTKNIPRVLCGALNLHAFQQLAAVRWASEIINNRSWPGEFAIDVVVHDTCGESGIAITETNQIVKWAKNNPEEPLIGVVVVGSRNNERIIDKPLETLNKENISAVVTSARAAELLLTKHPNVFTTAPDISSVTESILALLQQLGSNSVAVISSCSHAIKRFESLAGNALIGAKHYLVLQKDSPMIYDAMIKFLEGEAGNAQSVVLFLESTEIERLVKQKVGLDKFKRVGGNKAWILGSVGVDQDLIQDWSRIYDTNLLVMQPHVATIPDFREYFLSNLEDALTSSQVGDETREYIQKMHGCNWATNRNLGSIKAYTPCKSLDKQTLASKFHPEADINYIVSAVSAYSAALRLAQLEVCTNETDCDAAELANGVTDALRKLNYPTEQSTTPTSVNDGEEETTPDGTVANGHELEGTRGRINQQGKLVGRKYDLFLSKSGYDVAKVGQYASDIGLTLDKMLGLNPDFDPKLHDYTETARARVNGQNGKKSRANMSQEELVLYYESINARHFSPEEYISRGWALGMVSVGIVGVFLSLFILVYVLIRMCDGTLQGSQVLGILLLLGIMMLYSSVVMFVLPPGKLMCNLRIFLPSLTVTMCYGILLLKLMQLRSLVTLGLGGSVSSLNTFVTLFFIVAVQLVVNLQWFLTRHYNNEWLPTDLNECDHPHQTYLLLHSYVAALVVCVCLYGLSTLKIRRNYNEARWITVAGFLSLPIVLCWSVVVFFAPETFQEPTACASFLVAATVILFTVFIPKLSTINQQINFNKKKNLLATAGPGYTGSISTIFTTLSDRGHGTLQSQKRPTSTHSHHHQSGHYPPPPPPMPNSKSVTYSPRLTTNIFNSSSAATSLARSVSMKTPFYDPSNRGGAYP